MVSRSIQTGKAWEGVVAAIKENKEFPPPWFKIENYRAAKDFGALQWYEQLHRRQALLPQTYELGKSLCDTYEDRLWRIYVANEAAQMRLNPLGPVNLVGIAVPDQKPITELLVVDLMKQADRDRNARPFGLCDRSATQRWRVIRNPQASYIRHERLSQQPVVMDFYDIRKAPRAVIQVDLGATNTVLRVAFEQWLQDARAHDASAKGSGDETTYKDSEAGKAEDKTREAPYDRWAFYKILPYIDLAIWAMEIGTEFKRPKYAQALCDGHYRTPENIKTTTEKFAAQLMRDLSKLKAFASYEA